MKVKFIACFQASNQVMWLCKFVIGLRLVETIQSQLKIYYYNEFAVLYSNNSKSSTKLKHIGIKFLTVKEKVHNGLISIEYIETNFMMANALTKALISKVFHEDVACMGINSVDDVQF
jgi:hypothetical protein